MSQKTNQVIGKIENALFSKVSFLNWWMPLGFN